jgi:RimK-like ATP-grasp domain
VRAARTLGLNVCGVDMLRSKNGPLVLEVNSSPGIEGLEKATGIDVAAPIIEFLERHAAPHNTRTKGKVSLCPVRLDCDTKANGAACSYGKSRQAYREI